jgi:hypothetical protein
MLKIIIVASIAVAIALPLYLSYEHSKKQEMLSLHSANESFDLLPNDDIMRGPDVRLDYSHLEIAISGGIHWHFVSTMNFYDEDNNLIKTGIKNRYVNCRSLDGSQIKPIIGSSCPSLIKIGKD